MEEALTSDPHQLLLVAVGAAQPVSAEGAAALSGRGGLSLRCAHGQCPMDPWGRTANYQRGEVANSLTSPASRCEEIFSTDLAAPRHPGQRDLSTAVVGGAERAGSVSSEVCR